MTPDDITRRLKKSAVMKMPMALTAEECEYLATLAQQGKAGGVALDYVPGLLDQTCPPKVWLQIDTSGDNDDRDEAVPESCWGDLTWCYEPIGGQEVVYIRADLVAHANSPEAGVTDEVGKIAERLRSAVKASQLALDDDATHRTRRDLEAAATYAFRMLEVLAPQPKDAT